MAEGRWPIKIRYRRSFSAFRGVRADEAALSVRANGGAGA